MINEHLIIIYCMQRMSQTDSQERQVKKLKIAFQEFKQCEKDSCAQVVPLCVNQSHSQCPTESIHYERVSWMNEYINVYKKVWYKDSKKVKVNSHGQENEETVNSLWNGRLSEHV